MVPTRTNAVVQKLKLRLKRSPQTPFSLPLEHGESIKTLRGRLLYSPALFGTKKAGRALVLSRDRRSQPTYRRIT